MWVKRDDDPNRIFINFLILIRGKTYKIYESLKFLTDNDPYT